jgi:phosphatidylglycerophosphate synthase
MIDGLHKSYADRIWNALAKPLARTGVTPNAVTCVGLLLIMASCAAYISHGNSLIFGLCLALSFAFDALDGAVARLQGTSSKFGGYLDAVIDRYQEIFVYSAIAYLNDWWALALFALSGSLMVSYAKARTAIEIPISNDSWPDLLERFERIVLLCAALIFDTLISISNNPEGRILWWALLVIGLLSHVTAVQRFFRARNLIRLHEAQR